MPLLPCAPHAPTGEPVRDLPSGVSGRAAGSREGDAGPGDMAPARVGQAGGSEGGDVSDERVCVHGGLRRQCEAGTVRARVADAKRSLWVKVQQRE